MSTQSTRLQLANSTAPLLRSMSLLSDEQLSRLLSSLRESILQFNFFYPPTSILRIHWSLPLGNLKRHRDFEFTYIKKKKAKRPKLICLDETDGKEMPLDMVAERSFPEVDLQIVLRTEDASPQADILITDCSSSNLHEMMVRAPLLLTSEVTKVAETGMENSAVLDGDLNNVLVKSERHQFMERDISVLHPPTVAESASFREPLLDSCPSARTFLIEEVEVDKLNLGNRAPLISATSLFESNESGTFPAYEGMIKSFHCHDSTSGTDRTESVLKEGVGEVSFVDSHTHQTIGGEVFPNTEITDVLLRGSFDGMGMINGKEMLPSLDTEAEIMQTELPAPSSPANCSATLTKNKKSLMKPKASQGEDVMSLKIPKRHELQRYESDHRPVCINLNVTQDREPHKHANDVGECSVSAHGKNKLELKPVPEFKNFIVEEEEGSGGYGTVYRAKRKIDGKTFAIKCPHENSQKHHILNELRMLERFGGKNFVIRFEECVKSGNSHCFVLEHVKHDRPEVLKRKVDIAHLRWYGYCMFRALSSLHKQGVVHRDVKPGNFLFSHAANKGYLIDFNLAMDMNQKYGTTNKSKARDDGSFIRIPLPHTKADPATRNRSLTGMKNAKAISKNSTTVTKSALNHSNVKKGMKGMVQTKIYTTSDSKSLKISQGADGSGITSTKEMTSTRTPSAERLKEPMPSHGRKELISLLHEAMQAPRNEGSSVTVSKRKRIAVPPKVVDRSFVVVTPMPLHLSGVAVIGSGLPKDKWDEKQKREGPCVGTKGYRAPEVLFRSIHQGTKVDVWSAGVTLLYLMIGRAPFTGEPEQNIKEIVKLKGSEELWELAKLHNRESSFPAELLDVRSLESMTLREWCKMNSRRPDLLEEIPDSLYDLVDKCLTVNPRIRISADQALNHEFFSPCHDVFRRKRQLEQERGSGVGSSHLVRKQTFRTTNAMEVKL